MSRSTSARHRSAARPSTPLTAFGESLTGPAARRAAIAVASSGVILTLSATASVAGGVTDPTAGRMVAPMANLSSLSEIDIVDTAPTVTVAADAAWSFDAAVVSSEAPPPPPPPPPVVVRPATTTAAASRTEDRPAQAAAAEPAAPVYSAAPGTATGAAVVDIARRYIGVPYVYGGASPSGFDCSGFTQYVFAQVGISLPRTSSAQRYAGYVVSASEALPGDLIWGPGHVGIYTGNGMHIAARQPGTPLYESEIYLSNPVFIRVIG